MQRRQGDGYSFAVTLSRIDKKTSRKDSVRLEPHPPCVLPSALEARHWGATYALYRVSVLRFLGRKAVADTSGLISSVMRSSSIECFHPDLGNTGRRWLLSTRTRLIIRNGCTTRIPLRLAKLSMNARQMLLGRKKPLREVIPLQEERQFPVILRMRPKRGWQVPCATWSRAASRRYVTNDQRDMITTFDPQAIALDPKSEGVAPVVIPAEDGPGLLQQLTTLGFKTTQARNAVAALSQASPIASVLLRSTPPLQACIEYLILQVPECDLPQRFLPTLNSSGSFVTSTHAGSDNLKIRWAEEKAVKECGWPSHVVKECMTDERLANDWELLISALNRRLLGDDWRKLADEEPLTEDENVGEDEAEAFGAFRTEKNELVIPMPIAPLKLVVVPLSQGGFRGRSYPPALYVTSPSVPAYIRLYLISRLLDELKSGSLPEEGESLVMGAVRLLEEEWISIEDSGPPDMATVLQNLAQGEQQDAAISNQDAKPAAGKGKSIGGQRRATRKQDDRSDARVKEDFKTLTASDTYKKILAGRRKLPAFSAQVQFLSLLEKNRCVVVVGETGKRSLLPTTFRG